MNPTLAAFLQHFRWDLALFTYLAAKVAMFSVSRAALLVPTFRAVAEANRADFMRKLQKPKYGEVMKRIGGWSKVATVVLWGVILPFTMTLAPSPWWTIPRDVFVILMFYDFFYYLGHRFLFHDEGFFGGPLLWVHAVHHRQHVPNRMDGAYLNPIELFFGTGLYGLSVLAIALLLGPVHPATVVITFVAFQQINLHNHDLWTADRFPFRYLNTMAVMHHNHHRVFTGGNFATISLFYDWLFGTLDHGQGGKEGRVGLFRRPKQTAAAE
ncbi:sterol desaturase family protein [Novosphingobium bradum]|uniref:Sterol desaturase family protein n=1 Tax=Novosphingobium bradum TaxID=1737444 RepID=A0ABV7IN96_9SPHN